MIDDEELPDDAGAIAVVGLSCRLPGARDVDEFWDLLVSGREGVTRYTDQELDSAGVAHDDPAFVPVAGAIDGPGMFDAEFFGLTPAEAAITDPQHRLFLECAWQALERSGRVPGRMPSRVGVFAGASNSGYRHERARHRGAGTAGQPLQVAVGNDTDMLALRVSYKLDLTGPSITVQTACSSALVAVHLACQSLLTRECDAALAGGAAVRFLEPSGYRHEEGGILSKDGHCRPFDAAADGTVAGDGAGAVVLKRLEDAIADGDHIHAVIRGTAVNNDGAAKMAITAPSVAGQTAVIAEALAVAGVDPATVDYVETHGTATPLGDPIEVRALADAFGGGLAPGSCLLGAVKSNIGHLDAAAGVAGLIKTVLALEHRFIPPTLHFTAPNPEAGLDGGPFRVCAQGTPWPQTGHRPRAGVSSFGFGGTNAHIVLEAAPVAAAREPSASEPWHVLPLSARTPEALDKATGQLAEHLRAHPEAELDDVAHTLRTGRADFTHRRTVICRDRDGAIAALAPAGRGPAPADRSVDGRWTAFLLPGQASQYAGMGAQLYRREPVFRAALDECAELLRQYAGWDVRDVAFDQDGAERLSQTQYTQPTVFALDYAMCCLLDEYGVRPDAMLGHSLGEIVAACLSGVFSLEDALRIVTVRARLMQELPTGAMLAVALPEDELSAVLDGLGTIAAVNAPGSCVVAVSDEEVADVTKRLDAHGVMAISLQTSHAFHSPVMDPVLDAIAEAVGEADLGVPRIPFVSNVTGTWITDEQATDPRYWAEHARRPVLFSAGLASLLKTDAVLLEAGPGSALAGLARAHRTADGAVPAIVTTMRRSRTEEITEGYAFAEGLAGLWRHGATVDRLAARSDRTPRRVPLPTYPFERTNHLLPKPDADGARIGARLPESRWHHVPVWRRSPLGRGGAALSQPTDFLVFEDGFGIGGRTAGLLRGAGHRVVTVGAGADFERRADDAYAVDPRHPEHVGRLIRELRRNGRRFGRVVHAWSVASDPAADDAAQRWQSALDFGYLSLIQAVQALTETGDHEPVRVDVVTGQLFDVVGEAVQGPQRAAILGAVTVLPQEFSTVRCRAVDVLMPSDDAARDRLAEQLVRELTASPDDDLAAYRGDHRWTRTFAPVETGKADAPQLSGVIVTGASGEAGMAFAEHLAATGARLFLVGEPGFPESRPDGGRAQRLATLLAGHPGQIRYHAADLADPEQARTAVDEARGHLGAVDGLVHALDVRGSGLVALKSREQLAPALTARARSVLLLDELLRDDPLELFLLVSSTTGIVGGFGQLENCAAAAFLDAFAHARYAGGRAATAVDWGQWDWDDWLEQHSAGNAEITAKLRRAREESGIPTSAGIAAAWPVVAAGWPQAVVSCVDLQDVLAGAATLTTTAYARETDAQRRAGDGGWDPAVLWPDDEIARAVAQVLHEVLGVTGFGPDDDFFALGGNSLFAIQVIGRLRERFDDLAMGAIFEAPTVRTLSGVIRANRPRSLEDLSPEELEALLAEIESLSPQEAEARLLGGDA
ncbi:MAG TPA: SDR family NAD(P)-dependent oxidoreductase [Actinocrinis sp.]|uniref:type I polyketide synthase n=1 Tax=Actinocrinis sp. TaxID=1920516 RepID=UPI002DDDB6F2|nr:SDR family NAD(P)-dependent oxidoreductase [Actinocrinis sp.]HEV2348029.1 SDR family NAD(P)-dependent oxidoreductase [Actinocrinis sp.]